MALRRAQRLRKNGDFQRVRQQRQSVSSRLLILAWSPHPESRLESDLESNVAITRVGFVVSKRISKNATTRNTIKRLLSEAVRSLWHEIPPGYDLVLTARHQLVGTDARTGKRVIVADLSTLKQDIRLLLRRAQLLVPAPVVDDTRLSASQET
ncbi:ribonuclease P protein component [Ktedonobacter robiniae]|uniref:Ribonuclease P protein component n=1 Tax=Ktedonobacter robiniae TaxID=2778365 RepID=A0ABQ3UK79_9CHLR|nr:ribonuclease P protein component [Ktedonobacter robiniae]GHO53137.1 hypothetical protein KSB_16120 [Ktedonobacter robiniae]